MLVLLAAVATGATAQTTYKVSVKEGTEDASNWQGKAGEGAYQELPLEGVAANTAVNVQSSGLGDDEELTQDDTPGNAWDDAMSRGSIWDEE